MQQRNNDNGGAHAIGECAVWSSARLYQGAGSFLTKGTSTSTAGAVLRFWFDFATGNVWIATNGTLVEGDPVAGTTPSYTVPTIGTKILLAGAFENTASARLKTASSQTFAYPLLSGWVGWDD